MFQDLPCSLLSCVVTCVVVLRRERVRLIICGPRREIGGLRVLVLLECAGVYGLVGVVEVCGLIFFGFG